LIFITGSGRFMSPNRQMPDSSTKPPGLNRLKRFS
jgi:hypothetical protein